MNEQELQKLNGGQQTIQYVSDQPTVLGDKFDIPFTVTNMQKAKGVLDSLQITSPNPVNIRTTHKYIKFFPQTLEQVEALHNSDSLIYFSQEPLDYEIVVQGGWYRASGIQDSEQTPLYASVPADYTVPSGINYTVLEELYLPDEDPILIGVNPSSATMDYINDLMFYAHDMVGHPDEIHFIPATGPYFEDGGVPGGPSHHGVIKVYDTRLEQNVPLEGVTIKAVKHGGFGVFTNRYGVTNELGQYNLSGTQSRGRTDYTMIFETPNFAIYRSEFFAFLDLTRTCARKKVLNQNRYHFSYNISADSGEQYDNMIAHMFRASYRYCYGEVDGLKRPIRGVLDPRQKLVAVNGSIGSLGINYMVFPVLKISRYRSSTTTPYNSDDYYSATIHELAHTAHVLTMNNILDYANVDLQIMESWCTAVEWYLTGLEYKGRGITNYGDWDYSSSNPPVWPNRYGYQFWNMSIDPVYTTLFINLVDDFNELGVNFPGETIGTVNDNVSGYNLGTIQSNYLKHIYSHASFGTYIKANKPSGVTNAQIDNLLSHY